MTEERPVVRLRQAVLAASEREPPVALLRSTLGLGEPFNDPAVGLFGLKNAVLALGDCFLEVVTPVQPETAAGRQLERRGDPCGYMAIFDIEDLEGARQRARDLGIRVAWETDLPDISTTHLHPSDMRGAIVSLDQSRPFGTWRWGGPDWTGKAGHGAPGRLTAITLAIDEPVSVAARWGQVLGVPVGADGDTQKLELDGAEVRFVEAHGAPAEGLAEIEVEIPSDASPEPAPAIDLGSLRLRVVRTDPE